MQEALSKSKEAKALCWVTWLCPIAVGCLPLLGYGIQSMRCVPFGPPGYMIKPCGDLLLHCLSFWLGICGALYMPYTREEMRMPMFVWIGVQLGVAWFLGFVAADLAQLGDGIGMGVFLLAPVLTLPSCLLSLIFPLALCRKRTPRSCLVSRSICLAILLGIMGTVVFRYCRASSHWRKYQESNPPVQYHY